jgi:hypothetical protein
VDRPIEAERFGSRKKVFGVISLGAAVGGFLGGPAQLNGFYGTLSYRA